MHVPHLYIGAYGAAVQAQSGAYRDGGRFRVHQVLSHRCFDKRMELDCDEIGVETIFI